MNWKHNMNKILITKNGSFIYQKKTYKNKNNLHHSNAKPEIYVRVKMYRFIYEFNLFSHLYIECKEKEVIEL